MEEGGIPIKIFFEFEERVLSVIILLIKIRR